MQSSTFLPDSGRDPADDAQCRLDELVRRERKLALALEGSRDGFWDWNVETGEVEHSDRWCEMVGLRPDEVIPHLASWKSLVHPEDLGDVLALLQAHLDGCTESYRAEYRMLTQQGTTIWVLDRGRVTERDATGRAVRMSGTHTDITERKQIELALRRRDAVLEAVGISAELLLGSRSWQDVTYEVLGWLGAATAADRVYLFSVRTDAAGETWARLRYEWVADGIRPCIDDPLLAALPLARHGLVRWIGELRDGRPIQGAVRDLPASEQPLMRASQVQALAIVPVRADGDLWGFMGFDACTEEREWSVAELDALRAAASALGAAIQRFDTEAALRLREEGLRRTHRMQAVARLAGGLAHEFNNMLTVIQGHAAVLESQLGGDPDTLAGLAAIRGAADRSAVLTRQLLAYGSREAARPQSLDLNAVIRNAQRVLAPALGPRVELVAALDDALPPVLADTTQLEQLLLNLAQNARAAMPDGGRFRIATRAVASERDGATDVVLTISDTGCGMDEQTLEHVFEPFFTTRPAGEALGLGLATVYAIVQQFGGSIDVSSGPGAGTAFTITLPAAAELEPAVTESTLPTRQAGGTVLLVEDDAAVRGLTRRLVERMGYQAIVASSGPEALAVLRGQPAGAVQLMLTDVLMPGMTGLELAARVRELMPGLPILLMSGYSEEAIGEVSSVAAGVPVLLKPFTPEALANKVREALELYVA